MVIVGPPATPNPEPCILTGEPRVRGDMRKNGKDKLIWEFEDWEIGRKRLVFDPEK